MRLFVLALCIVLAGCGFQLRGAKPIPYAKLYMNVAENSELGAILKRNIRAVGNTELTNSAKDADAEFIITDEAREKNILSLNSAGQVREFQLRYIVGYNVLGKQGNHLAQPGRITLTRDITFNDSQVLAKESEEQLLYRDMTNDMVQQLMRRLAAAQPVKHDE